MVIRCFHAFAFWRRLGLVLPEGVRGPAGAMALAAVLASGSAMAAGGGWFPDDRVLITHYGFDPAEVGYVLFDVDSGARVAGLNAERTFIPASVAKIPTTIVALNVLGPDYRFETTLWDTGEVVNGVLQGDLYLRGGGDPVLTTEDIQSFGHKLKTMGVTRVAGRFVYDSAFLPTLDHIDDDQPRDVAYNASIGALSLNFNRIRLRWRRGPAPGALQVVATSKTDFSEISVNSLKFGVASDPPGRGQRFAYSRDADGDHWFLSPALPKKGETWLPVKRPGLRAALVFRTLLAANGIAIARPEPGKTPADARLLLRRQSVPLLRIVRGLLKFSNNPTAELIGLVTSRRLAGKPLSLARSSALIRDRLKKKLASISWRGYRLTNHSGLGAAARITPAQMAAIVRFGGRQRYGRRGYAALLPRYDRRSRKSLIAPGRRLRLRVRAKSGTMDYGKALAGFLETRGRRRLGFALFISDFEKRRRYERDLAGNRPGLRRIARRWLRRARNLEADLIAKWTLAF